MHVHADHLQPRTACCMAPMDATTEVLCRKKRDRHNQEDEEAEDAELLADEEAEGEGTGRGHRLSVQPSVIKFGKMREYQIQGLNWLIHLYDNGINGILADEMVRLLHMHIKQHAC